MNILIRQFYINEPIESTIGIGKWWESKRFFFNISNIAALFIGILIIYLFHPSLINFFLFPFLVSYGILLNIIYFLGWIILRIIKKTWKEINITVFSSVMLIVFIVVSVFATLSLCISFLLFNIP